jgi:hypothetical protein
LEHTDDFAPILERGELNPTTGIIGRLAGRRNLPSVGLGVELVLADKEGKPIAGGADTTPGEKYWSKANSWIKVDVSEHTLELVVPFRDPTGLAGFAATVTVGTRVKDSMTAAALGVGSVRAAIAPVVSQAVAEAARMAPSSVQAQDPVSSLNEARAAAEDALRENLRGEVVGLPTWLHGTVKSVNVAFDEGTNTHYADLVERSRERQRIDAEHDNTDLQTTRGLNRDEIVRQALSRHLTNPATRSFEAAFKDPTPANIERAVAEANTNEARERQLMVDVLTQLISADHLHERGELRDAMEQVRAAIEVSRPDPGPKTLQPGAAQPAIDAEAQTVEHDDPANG